MAFILVYIKDGRLHKKLFAFKTDIREFLAQNNVGEHVVIKGKDVTDEIHIA